MLISSFILSLLERREQLSQKVYRKDDHDNQDPTIALFLDLTGSLVGDIAFFLGHSLSPRTLRFSRCIDMP